MKRKLATFVVALILAVGGGLMLSCGKSKTPATPIAQMPDVLSSLKSDKALFETGNVENLETDFVLTALKETDYNYFSKMLAVPLEYANQYSKDMVGLGELKLNNAEKNAKNSLEQHLTLLNTSYKALSEHNLALGDFDEGFAYDGALETYVTLCQTFVDSAYDVAFDVALLENLVYGKNEGIKTSEPQIKSEDVTELKNYLALDVAYDCYTFLVTNAKGENIKPLEFVVKAENALNKAANLFAREDLKSQIANSTVAELLETKNELDSERKNRDVSLNKFSLYRLIYEFGGNTAKYAKVDKNVYHYQNYIEIYYDNLGSVVDYYTTLLF